jgi:hypothetical protein
LASQSWSNVECNVSLWWPYVRKPGDCLTTEEKQNGMTGTYQDPDGALIRSSTAYAALRNLEGCEAITSPEPEIGELSARFVLPQGSVNSSVTITGSNFRCNTQAYFDGIPVMTNVLSPTELQVTIPQELAAREGNFQIALRNRSPAVHHTGVPGYNPNLLTGDTSAPSNPLAAPPPQAVPAAAPPQAVPTAAPPQAVTNERGCTTGILWPFYRDTGDCLTDAERESGMLGVYGNSRMPGQTAPDTSNPNVAPLPESSDSGGIFGIFGSGTPNYGGGGLLDDNLLPPEQRGQ